MRLKVIGSSSHGNGYALIADSGQILLIEAGCPLMDVKKTINFRIDDIVCCIVSHLHGDHAKHISQYLRNGIKVFSDLCSGPGSRDHNSFPILGEFSIGEFKVKPFDLNHDIQCHGFLINHEECGNVVFMTDTQLIPFNFNGLNQIIVEANYDENILDNNVIEGKVPAYLSNRVIGSHLSIENCKQFLQETDLSQVINIVLIHLSGDNSHAVNFAKEIKSISASRVWIADKGMEIAFDKNPF
jgi:phosphoribosyl 1,2-cyclic phosphodiesterase